MLQQHRTNRRGGPTKPMRGGRAWSRRNARRGQRGSGSPGPNEESLAGHGALEQVPEAQVAEPQEAQAPWESQTDEALFSQQGWWGPDAEEESCSPAAALGPPGAAQAGESPPEPEPPAWEMSEADRSFFEEVLDLEPKDLENQMTGWYQAQEGNCATVAVAKAATDILGVQVFKSIQRTSDGLDFVLQDGNQVSLGADELIAARKASGFAGENKAALAFGTVIYAVAAKRAEQAEHEGAESYTEALAALNNGEWTYDIVHFLGLDKQSEKVEVADLDGRDGVAAMSGRHAIYVDLTKEGHKADHYGTPVGYDGTDTNGSGRRRRNNPGGLFHALAIKPLEDEKKPRP